MSKASQDPAFRAALGVLLTACRARFPHVTQDQMGTVISEELSAAIREKLSTEDVMDRIQRRLAAETS